LIKLYFTIRSSICSLRESKFLQNLYTFWIVSSLRSKLSQKVLRNSKYSFLTRFILGKDVFYH